MRGQYLEKLTWPEAESAMKDYKTFLIPLGARCKEHGKHLPLSNDWRIAEYLTRRILERTAALALPTIQYGYYPAFLEYPGSISLSFETQKNMVIEICRSLAGQSPHGDALFYIVNTGISTLRPLASAREDLAKEKIRMEYLDLRVTEEKLVPGLAQQEAGTHADELETSMMLYMAPETVRMELAEKDIHPRFSEDGGLTRNPHGSRGIYSPTGAWGDPTLATRKKGEKIVEALVSEICGQIENF